MRFSSPTQTEPGPLHALVELARCGRTQDVEAVLAAMARALAGPFGYRLVAVNLFRPAWDDFEVVHVEGDDEARAELLGSTHGWEVWDQALNWIFERRGCFFLPDGAIDAYALDCHTPDLPSRTGADAWKAEDALLVPLRDHTGALLGVVSLDDPASGQRPTDEDLDVLWAVASHGAVALQAAQAAASARRTQTALEDLLRVSARVGAEGALGDALDEICLAVVTGMTFTEAAIVLVGPEGDLSMPAARGVERPPVDTARLCASHLAGLTRPEFEREGCFLLEREQMLEVIPHRAIRHRSGRNGRGPRAWDGHCLVAPLSTDAGRTLGYLWVADPDDRLVPDAAHLRILRLFADQAAGALISSARIERLSHLAERDPLTGVRNRRGLSAALDALTATPDRPASVLLCDLDHFKAVNDRLGHDGGDVVLQRFGALLAEHAGSEDLAFRLGGEEFCLLVPGADTGAAAQAATALRAAAARALDWVPGGGLTLSIGCATSGPGVATGPVLLRAADRALYAAKRLGRDRWVAYDPTLPDVGARDGQDDAGPLAAVLSLAEALDLRDGGTARHSRTVAAYAEQAGRALGLTGVRVERLRVAGALHDIGKIGVADAILAKPGTLDEDEWVEMRRHAELGERILARAGLRDLAGWVRHHHERMDGAGYPDGIAADALPLESRVLAVVDAYEAMTADRPYRRAPGARAARAELRRCAGTQFDPEVVDAFLGSL